MPETTLDFQSKAPDALQGAQNPDHAVGFAGIIGTLLSVVMTVGVLLLLFYLIMGAIGWLTSNGESGKMEEARNKITTAIVGMIILASVLAVVMFVQYILGIQVLTFAGLSGGPGDKGAAGLPTGNGSSTFLGF